MSLPPSFHTGQLTPCAVPDEDGDDDGDGDGDGGGDDDDDGDGDSQLTPCAVPGQNHHHLSTSFPCLHNH